MVRLLLLSLLLLSTASPLAAQTRRERWAQERLEKARHLEPAEPGFIEGLFLALERSLDEGWLGEDILGIPVARWLLLLGAAALLLFLLYRLTRRLRCRLRRARAP